MAGTVDVMQVEDYEQVAAVWEEVGMWPHAAEDRAWYERALARNPDCAFVWREEGRIIGTVVGAWDGLRGWIYHLAVLPAHQGKGLGRTLLAAAEQRLHALGVMQINLMVREGNARAQDLYLRCGYQDCQVTTLRKRFA